jgi:hypothetical protein
MTTTITNKDLGAEYKTLSNVVAGDVYDQLAAYTLIARYAGYNKEEKRRETWEEQIERVFKMHRVRYFKELQQTELSDIVSQTKRLILDKKILGSQRALQFGGPSVLKKNSRIYNCAATYVDRPRVFQEALFTLLTGVGLGFSVQLHHIAKLPKIASVGAEVDTYVIPDSIEGWSDALGVLLRSYFVEGTCNPSMRSQNTAFMKNNEKFFGKTVVFDYSEIRPAGSDISHIGGKAPGPDGLRASIEKIRMILEKAVVNGRLNSIECYDIMMHASDAVLSGGIRRSATLCLFSLDDTLMIKAKTGNWFTDNPQRARSNNSALLLRDETPEDKFMNLIESVKQFGEPGIIFADSTESLFNPCVEIQLYAYDKDGNSGIQFCVSGDTNLVTRSGITTIKNAIGKSIDIWNGVNWSSTVPVLTGNDKTLFRVKFSDGSHLDCTGNHRFSCSVGEGSEYIEITTDEILSQSTKTKEKFYVPSPNVKPDECVGIRTLEVEGLGYDVAQAVYPTGNYEGACGIYKKTSAMEEQLESINSMMSENFAGRNAFLTGWGKINPTDDYFTCGCFEVATALQLLVTSLGNSSQIMSNDDGTCNLVIMSDDYRQHIVSVTELLGKHDTYCLEEHTRHMCLFNNVMTKQCNLSEINMGNVTSPEDFYERCRAASVIGTLQAGYTEFAYLGKVTKSIVEREALIGVGMTGMMDTPDISFDPAVLREGARIVKDTNKQVAALLGINQAARTTCVKPAGSTSCILKTASGIHPSHSKRYLRRVQSNKVEGPLNFFKDINPQAVEKSVWSANGTDDVITFLCKAPEGAITKDDITAVEFLEKVKTVQINWVAEGTNKHICVKPWLCHNTSNTIMVRPDEWTDVASFIYSNRRSFAGISMLPSSGDMIYQQAPFQAVLTHNEIASKYGAGALFASGLIVHAQNAFDGNLFNACSCFLSGGCSLNEIDLSGDAAISLISNDALYKKHRWVAQARKFTKRHFDGDSTKMTYCLKAVDAWKTWCDLKRTYKKVDWKKFKEDSNNTKPAEYSACSGNQCEVIRF